MCAYDMFLCLVLLDFTVSVLWMCVPLYSNFTCSQITFYFFFFFTLTKKLNFSLKFFILIATKCSSTTPRRKYFILHTVFNVFKFFLLVAIMIFPFFIFTKGTSLNLISWNFIYFILMPDADSMHASERNRMLMIVPVGPPIKRGK